MRCFARVDLLILNDSEAREMTKETSLIKAGRRIQKMGPPRSPLKKVSMARCFLAKGTASSAAARTHWKTFTIRPAQGTRSPAAWPAISRAQ